jgi:AcrR family transcriptional regulator
VSAVEATLAAPRRLDGAKARRIVEAMRSSVAARGAAASTFDHVAREAGVSRGLLHYYFGSKERLLVEVVRHDCDERVDALEAQLRQAGSVDELVDALVDQLRHFLEDDPGSPTVVYEMLSASRHSEEIRLELAELYRRWRAELAAAAA